MHAFLISGGTLKEREAHIEKLCTTWRVGPFDRYMIEAGETSIGIAAVRAFRKQLSLKPQQSDWYVGIIPEAERLTTEAQQALLKTLEEPPVHARILLSAPSSEALLPTILSRIQRIPLTKENEEYTANDQAACWQLIDTLVTLPKGQRIAKLGDVATTKEDGIAWITLAIATIAQHLRLVPHDEKSVLSSVAHGLLFAKKMCGNNVHPLPLLEHVFLTLKS